MTIHRLIPIVSGNPTCQGFWALRHEAWWGAADGAVGLQTAPGASHILRMSDVQQEGGPRWANTVVRLGRGCWTWTWTAWRSSRLSWWVASGSWSSRPRPG